MSQGRIVVIGASAGGVRALSLLVADLTRQFPAPVLVVQHVGSHPSILPSLLSQRGPLKAVHASDGARIEAGTILIAPPDHHMMIDRGVICLVRGPKENHARPAIDPLFRTAAEWYGAAAIGVLLTGHLDDGTAGMQAIKEAGGVTVVQDPDDAEATGMPTSALRHVEIDHRVSLAGMGALLTDLAGRPTPPPRKPQPHLVHENAVLLGKGDFMEHLKAVGRPSTFTCPECHGALWEIEGSNPPRFRCHTGHGLTFRVLLHAQAQATEDALWGALRALQEKEMLLRSLAGSVGANVEAAELDEAADQVAQHGETLRGLIETQPPPLPDLH